MTDEEYEQLYAEVYEERRKNRMKYGAECMRALGLPEWACREHEENGTVFCSHAPQYKTVRLDCCGKIADDLKGWVNTESDDFPFYVCALQNEEKDVFAKALDLDAEPSAYVLLSVRAERSSSQEQELENYRNGYARLCMVVKSGVPFSIDNMTDENYRFACANLNLISHDNGLFDESGLKVV